LFEQLDVAQKGALTDAAPRKTQAAAKSRDSFGGAISATP
jgi:hypothetical protein